MQTVATPQYSQGMLPLLIIVTTLFSALFLLLITGLSKRHSKSDDLTSITDFFKRTADKSPEEHTSNSISAAIRHLNSLIKIESSSSTMKLDAAMFALESYPAEDRILLLSLTLISLMINNDADLQKELWQDSNHLQSIITSIQSSLSRAKAVDEPSEKEERLSAELQRRGCLLLGGFAENAEAAARIVELRGLDAIIDALQWYRFHTGVCKWGLWAVFHLCYDRLEYQTSLVEKNAIQTVCSCIKNNSCADVTRHGIAILFDVMRGDTEMAEHSKVIAYQEGLNDLLLDCMDEYPDDHEIYLMCQQILGGAIGVCQ